VVTKYASDYENEKIVFRAKIGAAYQKGMVDSLDQKKKLEKQITSLKV
jgi:hypothetical protein